MALLTFESRAQLNVESLEYWFDDYANAISQNIAPASSYSFNKALTTNNLNIGLHQFTIRFKDTNGNWSSPVTQFFYKKTADGTSNNEVVAYEYWLNNDYNNTIETTIAVGGTFTLDKDFGLSMINNGLHVFNIRFKDANNNWSSPVSHFFYKKEMGNTGTNHIESYQYWIDDNIEDATAVNVNGSATLALLDNLDLSRLKAGEHHLHIRFKDSNGKWSAVVSESFLKVALSLDDHLIAHYPFDGNANDESGEEHHGTVYGATLVADRNGNTNNAYQFDGIDDYIDLGDWSNGGAMTITFWARWDAFHNYSRIIDLANGSSSDNIIVSNYQQGSRLFWQIYSTSTRSLTSTENVLTPSQWNFYAVSVDESGHFKMYKNAALIDESMSGIVPRNLNRTEQFIGRSNFSQDGYFQGLIDDVRIYNKSINESDIDAVYNALPTNNTEIISLSDIKAYPNPVVSSLTLQLPDNNCRITVYNQNGRCVLDKESNGTEEKINMEKMTNGVYFVRIIGKGFQQTLKIIKR